MTERKALTPAQRVARSEARAIAAGARRINLVLRDPEALASLARLERRHGTATAAITAALIRRDDQKSRA